MSTAEIDSELSQAMADHADSHERLARLYKAKGDHRAQAFHTTQAMDYRLGSQGMALSATAQAPHLRLVS